MASFSRLILFAGLSALVWPGGVGTMAGPNTPSVATSEQELVIPALGPVRPGDGRRVEVTARDGHKQIGLLHCEVGDRRLVILPNGRLESYTLREAPLVEAPFKPLAKDTVAAELRATGFARFKTRSTARFVYAHNCSDEFYHGASRILETMFPAIVNYFKRQKFAVQDPPAPLVVILFRTEEEFRAYENAPKGVAAYYNPITNQIVIYEQSKLVQVAPELALKQAIGSIAHEGVHQILHNIGVQQRLSRWPAWTCEGLAEYFAPTSVNEQQRWKGVGTVHDLRMYQLEAFLKDGSKNPGDTLRATVASVALDSRGYAHAWALAHFLAARHREDFFAYLRDVSRLAPLVPRDPADGRAAQVALFEQHFGADYGALEDGLLEHLRSLPYIDPVANQTHYVLLLATPVARKVRITTSPADAEQWQETVLVELEPALRQRATIEIVPLPNRELAEEYSRSWLGSR